MLLVENRERVREEASQIDRERLQGKWIALSGRRAAQLSVEGDEFVLNFRNGDVYSGTMTLDPTQRPRTVDFSLDEGLARHQNMTVPAIYMFDGKHLILSPGEPGGDLRPRAFPPEGDSTRLCLVFRRC